MTNEPVQVVLNPEALRAARDRKTMNGNGKDFFAGRDDAFRSHKEELAASAIGVLRAITSEDHLAEFGGLCYVKVVMATVAIAKSHRPQKKLFRPAWTPHVGTAGMGEPIYACTPHSLKKVIQEIATAEITVPLKLDKRTGKMVPNPSRNRCEVSAIESINLWTATDKRDFSAAAGAAWLARAGTGGNYLVELFPVTTAEQNPQLQIAEESSSISLRTALTALNVDAQTMKPISGLRVSGVSLRVTDASKPNSSALELSGAAKDGSLADTSRSISSQDATAHQRVLQSLERNPLVRSIALPAEVRTEEFDSVPMTQPAPSEIFEREMSRTLAQVGVIDGGVSGPIEEWVEARWGQLSASDRDASHGTFISGLLVAAGQLNTYLHNQLAGCLIYDIDVLPADPGGTGVAFGAYYPNGLSDFMDEVESAVREFRESRGVRVFNFSMNFTAPGNSSRYGYAATRLDELAARYDVIFVISAGNVHPSQQRSEWPPDPSAALAGLANDTLSLLSEPGESLFNASVSALNPPGLQGQVPFALAKYSRRGPGLRGATKPDFAHIGGSGTPLPGIGSGLFSVDEHGRLVAGSGTSYAAPLVARRLADLDALIEGDVSREALLALLVHHAHTPEVMGQPSIQPVAQNLIGFGVPSTAEDMLQRDDSEISLVFESSVQPGEQATMVFAWPESLVANGKCYGYARLTLVARPVLAYEHGDERIRVNIGARLMQENKDGGFENRVHPVNLPPRTAGGPTTERELLKEAMKWQVVKCFDVRLAGRGPSSTWKFVVDYLTC